MWYKWCLVRYLNPADHHPARITKADKDFAKKFDFKDIKFQSKLEIQNGKQQTQKKNFISISVFGHKNKKKHPVYVSKKCSKEKHVALLSIGEKGKRYYVFIKDFNAFMHNHILHHG